MANDRTVPGTGTPDAVVETARRETLLGQVNALRGKFFLDATPVIRGGFELRDLATLTYTGNAEPSSASWSADFVDRYGNSATFGAVDDPETGIAEPFAIYRYPIPNSDAVTGEEAVGLIGPELDWRIAPFKLNPTDRTIFLASFEEDFGEEALREQKLVMKREERLRAEKEAPLIAEAERFRERVGIIKPDIYVQEAVLTLRNGSEVIYNVGDEDFPDLWVMSVHGNDAKQGKRGFVNFGYQAGQHGMRPLLGIAYFRPDHHAHLRSGAFESTEGLVAVPAIDAFIDSTIPERRQPFFSPLVTPSDNSQGYEETTGLPTPL